MASGSSSLGSLTKGISQINKAEGQLRKAFGRLSSGLRINSAADDAAGLAIADALKANSRTLGQASRNISDAGSAINIADSSLGQISDISTRMSELAAQAANGTLSDSDRSALNTEYQALAQEAQRIGATTEFNGTKLLEGGELSVQAGTGSDPNSRITVENANVASEISQVAAQDISTQAGAQAALDAVSSFSAGITKKRGDLGAASARLSTAAGSVEEQRLNSITAESRIRDANIAEEQSNLVSASIRERAATALQAQANKLNSNKIFELLR